MSGPSAARLLSAGVPLDLDLSAFPLGMATRTLLMKAEIGLWRREAERFARLEVARSFQPLCRGGVASSRRATRTAITSTVNPSRQKNHGFPRAYGHPGLARGVPRGIMTAGPGG